MRQESQAGEATTGQEATAVTQEDMAALTEALAVMVGRAVGLEATTAIMETMEVMDRVMEVSCPPPGQMEQLVDHTMMDMVLPVDQAIEMVAKLSYIKNQ